MTELSVWHPLDDSEPGPPLQVVVRRVLTTPEDFLSPVVATDALVADTLDRVAPGPERARAVDSDLAGRIATQVACWLVTEPTLIAALGGRARALCATAIPVLGEMVSVLPVNQWFGDEEHSEEVARAVFRTLRLRPYGESHPTAEDRWASINTLDRREALRRAAIEQEQAHKLAAQLAEKRAREAAAQYSHV